MRERKKNEEEWVTDVEIQVLRDEGGAINEKWRGIAQGKDSIEDVKM